MKTVLYTDVLYRAAELAGRPRDKLPVSEATMLQSSIAVDLEDLWNRVAWPELNPDPLNVTVVGQKFTKNEAQTGGVALINNDVVDVTFVIGGTAVPVSASTSGVAGTATGNSVNVQSLAGVLASADIPDETHFVGSIIWSPAAGITFTQTIPMGDVLTVLSANPHATTRYRAIGFQEGDDEVWIDENLASVWVDFMLPAPDLMSLTGTVLNNYAIPQRFRNYLSNRAAAVLLAADAQGASAAAFLALAETALQTQLNRLPSPPDWRQVRVRTGFGRRRHTSNATLC